MNYSSMGILEDSFHTSKFYINCHDPVIPAQFTYSSFVFSINKFVYCYISLYIALMN